MNKWVTLCPAEQIFNYLIAIFSFENFLIFNGKLASVLEPPCLALRSGSSVY